MDTVLPNRPRPASKRGHGGFLHTLANLGVAFAGVHLAVWQRLRGQVPWGVLVHLGVLLGMLSFVAANVNAGQKYAMLTFGPSYFLLLGRWSKPGQQTLSLVWSGACLGLALGLVGLYTYIQMARH